MDHGIIGALPFDLMNLIFFETSLQAAVSIYLSCKYWRDKYEHIINHDTIILLIASRYIKDRSDTIYSIKNGFVSYYCGPNYYKNSTEIKRGYFSSVRDLAKFLQLFKEIMTEPAEDIKWSKVHYCILRTTSPSGISKYFGYLDPIYPPGMQILNLQTTERLKDMLDEFEYYRTPKGLLDDEDKETYQIAKEKNLKLIQICIRHRKTPSVLDRYDCNILINVDSDGNFQIDVGTKKNWIRTTPMIYQEIIEVVKYSKHKKDISKSMDSKNESIVEAFELTLMENDELYYIQEYKLRNEDDTILIENNGYKTNALKKVLKILERITQRKSLEVDPFLKETILLPPVNSLAYSLARIQHYAIPMYGFPLISSIKLNLTQSHIASSLENKILDLGLTQSNPEQLPIEELISLLVFVTQNMDYRVLERSTSHKKYEISMKPMFMSVRRIAYFKVNEKALDRIYALVLKYGKKKE